MLVITNETIDAMANAAKKAYLCRVNRRLRNHR